MNSIIYKYMPFREEFFENRWLRFTPRLSLNDPFEVRPSFSQHAEFVHRVNGYGDSVESVIQEMERNQWLVLRGIAIQDFDIYGILSLTEKNDNLLMWSHYAREHAGMVIGFDSNHDFFDATKSEKQYLRECANEYIGVLKRVKYSKYRNISGRSLNEYFYLKSNDWWTEREIRYVLPIEKADKIIHTENNETMAFYVVPPDAIVSITLGMRMDGNSAGLVKRIIRDRSELSHIKIFQTKMCNETFNMVVESIQA